MKRKIMNNRGHPKKPIMRKSLLLDNLVKDFIEETTIEEPSLAKQFKGLNNGGRNELGGILGRFDLKNSGRIEAGQRLLARRVLMRLNRVNPDTLALTNKVLDYLDINQNAILEESEIELGVKIMETFARADSDKETLSPLELEMLYAVLRHIDSNDNGKLDGHEREQLLEGLTDPKAFLARQKIQNPFLQEVLA